MERRPYPKLRKRRCACGEAVRLPEREAAARGRAPRVCVGLWFKTTCLGFYKVWVSDAPIEAE